MSDSNTCLGGKKELEYEGKYMASWGVIYSDKMSRKTSKRRWHLNRYFKEIRVSKINFKDRKLQAMGKAHGMAFRGRHAQQLALIGQQQGS